MTKKLPLHEKINRKPISRACAFCHQKHIQCDHGRPCKNCVKRGLGDTCTDVERKKAKYLDDNEKIKKRANNDKDEAPRKKRNSSEPFTPILPNNLNNEIIAPSSKHDENYLNSSLSVSSPNITTNRSNSTTSIVHNRIVSQDYESSPDAFSSLFANQEYAQLADLLDNNIINSPSQSSVHTITNLNTEFQTSFQSENNTRPYISLSDNSTQQQNNLSIDEAAISKSLLNDNQEPYYTSPLILRHLIQQPEDVYTTRIQPYNYPMAYHVLLNYLKVRFKKEHLIQIAETMAEYRPSFIAATRSLVEMDLLFAERSFQRSLLEYESISSLSSSPTIMWRRSGEIVAVSTEFSSLTAHTKTDLLSKRTFIVELMNDRSALDYFKLFSSVAFGDLNGVIITECTLLSPSGEEIRCASTWTVKRDVFDIPMLVVGQFLPILQVR